jgi:hypothetical protein
MGLCDPKRTALAEVHRLNRLERWLYSGLHKFDVKILYEYGPAWDIVMLVLCLGGLAASSIGGYLGIKRIVRNTVRSARDLRNGARKPAPA